MKKKREITNKDLAKLIDTLAVSTAKGFANIATSVNDMWSEPASQDPAFRSPATAFPGPQSCPSC